MRVIGLDDSVSQEEVACVVADLGECTQEDVKVGPIRIMGNGLGMVWAQCPLGAAIKASAAGKIKIGWTIAKIELLKARPTQCFKCWNFGHVRYACRSAEDRSGACFNCGERGHSAQACQNEASCILCKSKGLPEAHRMGSPQCRCRPGAVVIPVQRTEEPTTDYD